MEDAWADPGRFGKSSPAILARFCAAMVSFNEGLEVLVRGSGAALLDEPVVDAETLVGFGFAESFRSSSCCFSSKADVILALHQRDTSRPTTAPLTTLTYRATNERTPNMWVACLSEHPDWHP